MSNESIEAFPLAWPVGWARTPSHRIGRSRYSTSFTRALKHLQKELALFNATSVIVSTNIQLRRDGLPYASAAEPRDRGVAVYWTMVKLKGGGATRTPMVMACDQWATVAENIHAIGLAIAAMRMISRTGASTILERAFSGFTALPAGESWRDVLGFGLDASVTMEHVKTRHRELAFANHPDRGGSIAAMARINDAADRAKRELS